MPGIMEPDKKSNTEELFFRSADCSLAHFNESHGFITFGKGAAVSFDTYFNSFSSLKWKKYSLIENVSLKILLRGCFDIVLEHVFLSGGDTVREPLSKKTARSGGEKPECFIFKFPLLSDAGIFAFKIEALENNSVFFGGEYFTDLSDTPLSDVKIAVNICTYKREAYIEKNLAAFDRDIFSNPASPLYNKIGVYIADNARSLDENRPNNENVRVFPNKNAGGAGGFTRGLIEILKSGEAYTHVIMMDDDITFLTESIERTYKFLRLLKNCYRSAFIGGAMLSSDEPCLQRETSAFWDSVRVTSKNKDFDVRSLLNILINETTDPGNLFGWWYCVMPMETVRPDNLPLPIFIKRDDIEYSVRNATEFITLNGICVWHEPFDKKRQAWLDYYYIRNMCILNALHFPEYSASRLCAMLFERLVYYTLCYKYPDMELCIKGAEDFLKGIDFLETADPEDIHAGVVSKAGKYAPVNDLIPEINTESPEFKEKVKTMPFDRRKMMSNLLLLFAGWFLPANKTAYVNTVRPHLPELFRAKKAVYYEESSDKAIIYKKSYKSAFSLVFKYIRLVFSVFKNFNKIKNEYKTRAGEIINIDFWTQYLGVER